MEFDETARELGLTPVLWRGTCLGIYRDGTYTESDTDIDVAVETKGRERLCKKLIEQGFTHGIGKNHLIKARMFLDIYTYDGKTETIAYKGREYNVPSPVEKKLEKWYGKEWRTPVLTVGGGTTIKTKQKLNGDVYTIFPAEYGGQAEVRIIRPTEQTIIDLDNSHVVINVKNGVLVKMEDSGLMESEVKETKEEELKK